MSYVEDSDGIEEIAVIGIAGRFPDANTIDELWSNLIDGKCSIKHFTKEEYIEKGYRDSEFSTENFVPALGYLEDIDAFDESFFKYSPNEVKTIDPQHRIFLETAWQALHDAGINPYSYKKLISVFAGSGYNYSLANQLLSTDKSVLNGINLLSIFGSDKDFLTTRVAYKLDLRGPSYSVQSACSTSLLAVHQGVQNLLTYQCDVALCGGVSIQQPKIPGYIYVNGEIFSPNGTVKVFDEEANGTVFGEGCGIVVLKRLSEAKRDNDNIYAVIKSSAANNDGSRKAGYTAPSIEGQKEVLQYALELANVSPSSVSYVEAHGTGTALGDVIELSALREVYGSDPHSIPCFLGSIKANIGHLDAAAGVTGLIKTILCLKNNVIPRQINVNKINPDLHINESSFQIPLKNIDWFSPSGSQPRRAAVSSFGVGGTNVHLILEEAPKKMGNKQTIDNCFIPISSHNTLLAANTADKLKSYIEDGSVSNKDVLNTLFDFQFTGNARTGLLASKDGFSLLHPNSKDIIAKRQFENIVFMFPGQGSQYFNMGECLYLENTEFRNTFDELSKIIKSKVNIDIYEIIFNRVNVNDLDLNDTFFTQICLFAVEYSIYKSLAALGIQPTHLVGHSLGELTAAAVSGVFGIEDAIDIILSRGNVLQNGPSGKMVAVFDTVENVRKLCNNNIYLAVENGKKQSVLSCSDNAYPGLLQALERHSLKFVALKNNVPFHTPLLKDSLSEFVDILSKINFNAHSIPFLSNCSGDWADNNVSTSLYWTEQVTSQVRFLDNLKRLSELNDAVFIEVGPGQTLSGLCRNYFGELGLDNNIVSMLPLTPKNDITSTLYAGLGKLWSIGIDVDFHNIFSIQNSSKVHLPPYEFLKNNYPIEYYLPADINTGLSNSISKEIRVAKVETYIENENNSENIDDIFSLVLNAWKNLLGYDSIDIHTNFFSLGGDSISATKIIADLSRELNIQLSPFELIEYPTIAQLELRIKSVLKEGPSATNKRLEKAPNEDVEATSAQKRFWFLHEYEKDKAIYNLAQPIRITKEIDAVILEEAINEVVRRHKTFNTVIVEKDGQPYLHYVEKEALPLSIIDLQSEKEPESSFKLKIVQECKKPVQLDAYPIYKIVLYKISKTDTRLVLFIPHILSDGWSFDIFQKELEILYSSLLEDTDPVLPEHEYDFYDYAYWQQKEKKKSAESIAYWKSLFSDEEYILQLPSDYPRPVRMKNTGRVAYFSIDQLHVKKIKDLVSKQNVTLFTFLFCVFNYLLKICTGQKDIVIGVPYANRDRSEFQNVIGLFLNLIPIKISYETDYSLNELYKRVQGIIEEGLSHSDAGIDEIVTALALPRHDNINPLFQVMFAFQNYMQQYDDTRLGYQYMPDRGISEYDLSLYMWEDNGRIEGAFEYSDELFRESTISLFIELFGHLLDQFASKDSALLSDISPSSEKEQELLLNGLNSNEVDYTDEQLFLPCFEKNVELDGQKIAARFEGSTISYDELNRESARLALVLQAQGIGSGDLVGIYLNRGIEMLISILGIFKSGAAYVPLDPHFPADRLELIIDDANLKAIITETKLTETLQVNKDVFVNIEKLDELCEGISEGLLAVEIEGEDRAYILYTSGSTGKPKGVQVPHRALVNFLLSMRNEPGMEKEDKILALTTISFDISILELLLPLVVGAEVEIVSYETALNATSLMTVISDCGITISQATPATWQMLLDAGWEGKENLKILCGGESLSQDLTSKIVERKMDLWNMYGPTETTVWSSIYHIESKEQYPLIGHPIANTTFYILDDNQQIVPPGVPGELYIGGDGVSLGYLNRPELNAERFIPDPFSGKEKALMYRTGDRVRYAGDGNVRYLERTDNQVKIRGFRIELGDIETFANEYPEVLQSVCVVKTYTDTDKRLVLFVRGPGSIEEAGLKSYLQKKLPNYMIPSHIGVMEEFPLTPNGKIDRKALPDVEIGREQSKEFIPATTDLERRLVGIWQEVLKVEKISLNDNFFEIGGHSLLAAQLIYKINKTFGTEISLGYIFSHPVIEDFITQNNWESAISPEGKSYVFNLNHSRMKRKIFCVLGVQIYQELAKELSNTAKCFGMYIPEEETFFGDDFSAKKLNVNVLASAYKELILKHCDDEPISILGLSFGGLVAYELAKQLSESGIKVERLIMLDSLLPSGMSRNFISWVGVQMKLLIKKGPFNRLKSLTKLFNSSSTGKKKTGDSLLDQRVDNYMVAMKAFEKTFSGDRFQCNSLLFKAEDTIAMQTGGYDIQEKYGWDRYLYGNIDIQLVPGNHLSILRTPQVQKIARIIKNAAETEFNINYVNVK